MSTQSISESLKQLQPVLGTTFANIGFSEIERVLQNGHAACKLITDLLVLVEEKDSLPTEPKTDESLHENKLKEGRQKLKAARSKIATLQTQLNEANEMLQAQLEEKRPNTVLQAHPEDSKESNAIDLAYYRIRDFVSYHLLKYINYILNRKIQWGPFVHIWEADGEAYQNMENKGSKLVWNAIEMIHGKRKDWNEKMHKDVYRKVAGLILFWRHRIRRVHDKDTIASMQRNSASYYFYLSHRIKGVQSEEYRFETDHLKQSVLTLL